MKTIYKYPVSAAQRFSWHMPKDAKVLSIQVQGAKPQMWALVDPSLETEPRTFATLGTGHSIEKDDSEELIFIGTFQLFGGTLVYHVFEVVSVKAEEAND